eukprot:scaffold95058_cov30-Tisochrysis_lutea.AAC.4
MLYARSGRPPAGDFEGHYVLLVGLDDGNDAFRIKDPARSCERCAHTRRLRCHVNSYLDGCMRLSTGNLIFRRGLACCMLCVECAGVLTREAHLSIESPHAVC